MRCTQFRSPFLRWTVGIGYAVSFTAMVVKIVLCVSSWRYGSLLFNPGWVWAAVPTVNLYRYFLGLPPMKILAKKAAKP